MWIILQWGNANKIVRQKGAVITRRAQAAAGGLPYSPLRCIQGSIAAASASLIGGGGSMDRLRLRQAPWALAAGIQQWSAT